jgi:hypothetical protein
MESFFRRVSSIVRKGSNKSFDVEEKDEEGDGRLRRFRQMQQRRRSAPDIRRRTIPIDEISMESDQKVASFEKINSQNLTIQSSTTIFTRKQSNSTGKFFLFNSLKIFFSRSVPSSD